MGKIIAIMLGSKAKRETFRHELIYNNIKNMNMRKITFLMGFIFVFFNLCYGQGLKNEYTKRIKDELGIELVSVKSGLCYYDTSSDRLIPYVALTFKNDKSIQERRGTGWIESNIKRNGERIERKDGQKTSFGKQIDPTKTYIKFLIYNTDVSIDKEDRSEYTIECSFVDRNLKIGEFKVEKINFKVTYREDFVKWNPKGGIGGGGVFIPKQVDFNKL